MLVMRSNSANFKSSINWPSEIAQTDTGLVQPLDVNGDGLDDLVLYDNGSLLLYKHQGTKPDLLTNITDGFGAVTTITYDPLSNPSVYTVGTGCTYPTACVQNGLWLVSQHTTSNGNGGVNSWQYSYSDARRDLAGRGLIGMSNQSIVFVPTGQKTSAQYDLSVASSHTFYPFATSPQTVTETTPLENGMLFTRKTINSSVVFNETSGVYFPFIATSDVTESETTGGRTTVFRTLHTNTDGLDAFGNITHRTFQTGDGQTYTFAAQYQNDSTNWLIQNPLTIANLSSSARHELKTRQQAFVWDASGLLSQLIIEPGNKSGNTWLPRQPAGPGDDGVRTLYRTITRYPNGLIQRDALDASPTPTPDIRSTDYVYAGPDQVYTASVTNALGQVTQTTYHPALGTLIGTQDPNGVVYQAQIDGFGRLRTESIAGGDSRSISYVARPGTSLLEMQQTWGSGPRSFFDYDQLARPVQLRSLTRKDGQPVLTDWQYDNIGRRHGVSLPHFVNEPAVYTTYGYDNQGRLRFRYGADGATTELRYAGLRTDHIDALGNQRSQITDQMKNVTSAIDPGIAGDVISSYAYGPFSTLESITDPAGNTIAITYDRLGRKIHLSDPDAGQRDYVYSPFGDVLTETVNQTDIATYGYDALARPKTLQNTDGMTSWIWHKATLTWRIGYLAQTASPDQIVTNYSYDSYSRLSTTRWTALAETAAITREYDAFGRLSTLQYPATPGMPSPSPFAVDYQYAAAGDLDRVIDHNAPTTAYYTVLDSDAAGAPTNPSGSFPAAMLGNGLVTRVTEDPTHRGYPNLIAAVDKTGVAIQTVNLHFNLNGSLNSRSDSLLGTTETFGNDPNDRLQTWVWSGAGITRTTTFGYDDLTNLHTRTVAEDATLNVTYGYGGAGPHAATTKNGAAYGYDPRGRQRSAPGRTATYNWFDLPTQITNANGATHFAYDADARRVLKTAPDGSLSLTVGDGLAERRASAGTTQDIFTIYVGNDPVAQVTRQEGPQQLAATNYLLTDHLGSVDTITDESGAILARLKYDPFGGRVNPTRLDQTSSCIHV